MIRAILKKIWSLRHEFARYFTIGVSGLALDMALLWFIREYGHVRPVVAIVFSQIITLAYNFTLNKYWAFENRGKWQHAQLIRYGTVVGWNYSFSIIFMWIFNEKFGFHYLLVRVASIAMMVSWNFLLYRFWVFKNRSVATIIDV